MINIYAFHNHSPFIIVYYRPPITFAGLISFNELDNSLALNVASNYPGVFFCAHCSLSSAIKFQGITGTAAYLALVALTTTLTTTHAN